MTARSILLGVLACSACGPAPIHRPAPIPEGPGLISTSDLVPLMQRDGATILDLRPAWTDFLQGHLPGAVWLNQETLRSSKDGLPFQLWPFETYRLLFTRLGVRPQRPVVVYSPGETQDIDATFVAWLLVSSGEREVYVLDGGFAKWQLENRPIARHYAAPALGEFPPRVFRPDTASVDDVRRAVERKDELLVDARNPQQFEGSAGAQMRRGHIPGAINHPWASDLERRDLALVWKSQEDLRAGYALQGITPDRSIIVYCNTSTEASHVFFALHYLLGYPRVRIYAGAWSQWAEREDLPVATGGGQ